MARTQKETREFLRDHIRSGEWWVLVDVGTSDLPRLIERRYYPDNGHSGDFQLIIGPDLAGHSPVAFFLMRRTRMKSLDLAQCVKEVGGESLPPELFDRRPFFFSPRNSAPNALALAVNDWLGDASA